jgi:TRAP-type mannitol/chloroaromatic compound transport system substrate-binding protein
MKALSAKGVLLHRWPSKILDALENSWRQVATEEAAKDREFKRVWQSLSNFRRNYAIWKELGSL